MLCVHMCGLGVSVRGLSPRFVGVWLWHACLLFSSIWCSGRIQMDGESRWRQRVRWWVLVWSKVVRKRVVVIKIGVVCVKYFG